MDVSCRLEENRQTPAGVFCSLVAIFSKTAMTNQHGVQHEQLPLVCRQSEGTDVNIKQIRNDYISTFRSAFSLKIRILCS
jgi:hypothetical protein